MPAKLKHRAISGIGERLPTGAYGVEILVHFSCVEGQEARTLCGWDGGHIDGDGATDDEVTCKECLAIYKFFRPKGSEHKGVNDGQ